MCSQGNSLFNLKSGIILFPRLNQVNDFKSEDAQCIEKYIATSESRKNRLDHLKIGNSISIVSWNINSIRARMHLIDKLIYEENPDILCLQETKIPDDIFPAEYFKEKGYSYIFYRGQKAYSGVAILSKIESELLPYKNFVADEARDIAVYIPKYDLTIHNLYVPAGYDYDGVNSVKFAHKIKYVEEMIEWNYANKPSRSIFLGDVNIAPLDNDVWSHKQLLKEISHTPREIDLFKQWESSGNLIDAPRQFCSEDKKLYSWWSYRNRDYKKTNRGRRLDHFMLTSDIKSYLSASSYLYEYRSFDNPSDHIPIATKLTFFNFLELINIKKTEKST